VDEPALPKTFSEIQTIWTKVHDAAAGAPDAAAQARSELLVRYHEAVFRYLLKKLRDEHAAGELASNFALRVLQGGPLLERADPERGRFRDYLKGVLSRMVIDYYRQQQRENRQREAVDVEDSFIEPAAPPESLDVGDPDPDDWWRQELLNQAWRGLEATEKKTGQPYCSAVRLKEENAGLRSQQLAEMLSQRLGRPFTAANVRKIVQRGREMFGDLLVAEVARSLFERVPGEKVTPERIEQELIELKLFFGYCKEALQRYAQGQ
jgi:RNA polymerase sigma factor (sigma-70 family)